MDAGGERSGGGRAEHISLFDAANDAIFVHDADTGQIVDVNLRMTEMYGYSVEEACGLSVADLSAGEPYTQARAVELLRKAATGEPQLFEWHARDRAGRRFWVEVNIKRAAVAGTERLLAIVRDVTERKRAEAERAELLARAQEAAREAEEARADNARLFEQAERRAAALAEERLRREHFISLVAHELRGSMSVISGYAALLRQGAIPDEARHTRALEVIAKQVHSLDRLVSDLLDLSLIEAGRFSVVRSPTDLLAVAREVVQHYHDCAAGHELILVLPPEPLVGDWDPGRLAQAASNLVSNAIKYAPSGAIRVAVRLEGDEAVLSVADEGPGITPEEREAIVQPYVRLGRGETRQGVGLGLTIVAAIAAAHGGRLIIDSALGQGSTFTLRLPRGA